MRSPRKIARWALWLVIVFPLLIGIAYADAPREALRYQRDLTRTAHATWGLDAPVAAFAAQIHQESGWNPRAVSRVGAKGMAQFMPATARWWCDLNNLSAEECQPTDPVWAMRALVGYDRRLFERVRGNSEFDRLWAALRAYNGGLGHWQKEAATVRPALDRQTVDSACGKARRHIIHCPENLGYPHRILIVLQPRYLGWGRGVQT
ncbi:MAG: transglycosylase SLT domain-containing protein [Nitrosomonadales bacterium]|nr:transglycosylase SLT domain-containing protein [Nitrosomonadales bacterium]